MLTSLILAQSGNAGATQGDPMMAMIVMGVFGLIMLITLIGVWRVFSKAGQPGWGCLIPIYNAYLMCRIAGRPGWWLILLFLPVVNLVISILLFMDMAKNFGKSALYGLGLAFLPFPFFPMLGFGKAQYGGGGNDYGAADFDNESPITEPTGGGRPI